MKGEYGLVSPQTSLVFSPLLFSLPTKQQFQEKVFNFSSTFPSQQ